ncbi:hypothetical protein EDC01DRAFT_629965 [Geopyxis carbonaria]|nr:hypothetical protein EDC01DRAFT_629965 [Geopyxis carbonaria]
MSVPSNSASPNRTNTTANPNQRATVDYQLNSSNSQNFNPVSSNFTANYNTQGFQDQNQGFSQGHLQGYSQNTYQSNPYTQGYLSNNQPTYPSMQANGTNSSAPFTPQDLSISQGLPVGWDISHAERALKSYCRKRRSNSAPREDEPSEDDDDRTIGAPTRAKKLRLDPLTESKIDNLTAYLRRHYGRYFSISEQDVNNIIHMFFPTDLSVNDGLYISVREKMKKLVRSWQHSWVLNFESYWAELTKASNAARCLKEFDTIIEYLEDMFSLEKFHAIMDFGHDTLDYTKITDQPTMELIQNLFTYFGAYVRRADLFPSTEGKLLNLEQGLFTRVKLLARSPDFDHIKVSDIPLAIAKPEVAKRTPRRKVKDIKESHPGFVKRALKKGTVNSLQKQFTSTHTNYQLFT